MSTVTVSGERRKDCQLRMFDSCGYGQFNPKQLSAKEEALLKPSTFPFVAQGEDAALTSRTLTVERGVEQPTSGPRALLDPPNYRC